MVSGINTSSIAHRHLTNIIFFNGAFCFLPLKFDYIATPLNREIVAKMMSYAPKTVLTRCRAQARCMTSFSSLTRTSTYSDSNNYLNIHALGNNTINRTKAPLPETPKFYDRSLLDFSSAKIELPTANFDEIDFEETIQATNRNARKPKKANKGSRPCSRAGRRRRKEKIGKRSR